MDTKLEFYASKVEEANELAASTADAREQNAYREIATIWRGLLQAGSATGAKRPLSVFLVAQPDLGGRIKAALRSQGAFVSGHAHSAAEAEEHLALCSADLFIIDIAEDFAGAAKLVRERQAAGEFPVVFVCPDEDITRDVLGAFRPLGFLSPRFDPDELTAVLARAARARPDSTQALI